MSMKVLIVAVGLMMAVVPAGARCSAEEAGEMLAMGSRPAGRNEASATSVAVSPPVDSAAGLVDSAGGERGKKRRERVHRGVEEQLTRFKEIAAKGRKDEGIYELVEGLAREDAEWSEVPRLRPVLRELLKHDRGTVKREAASSLGMVGEEEDIPALEALLKVTQSSGVADMPVSRWAQGAIGQIQRRAEFRRALEGKTVEAQVKILVGTFRGMPRPAFPYVCARLIRIGPPAVPALVELLEEALSGHFPADRIPAMWWIPSVMGEIGDQRAAPILGKLAAYLRRSDGPDSNWTRRVEAVIAEMEGRQEGGGDK